VLTGLVFFVVLLSWSSEAVQKLGMHGMAKEQRRNMLHPTHSGYLPVRNGKDSAMYYMYFEADEPSPDLSTAPIILWLQGGPGCSSLFGAVYINGPWYVQPDLSLRENPGRWNKHYGVLYVDQPIGVGFSVAGSQPIPHEELTLAGDLYNMLQAFYRRHSGYQNRPLYVTGESYAGKYVPSLTHYIVQAQAITEGWVDRMKKTRDVPQDIEAPVFKLGGAAIGNGFTDAVEQTKVQGLVAFGMGMIDANQLGQAEQMQENILDLVKSEQWHEARVLSDQLMAFITNASSSASLEDIRRDKAYDADDLTAQYFNLPEVKANVGARADIKYVVCSKEVDGILGHDMMKSVSNLVPDILEFSHLLVYLGQFDAECGVASNEAWLNKLAWRGHTGFNTAKRHLWIAPALPPGQSGWKEGMVLGYHKSHMNLTQIVVRNAGHMVPHDRPEVSQLLLETWVESTRKGEGYDPSARPVAAAPEGKGAGAAKVQVQ